MKLALTKRSLRDIVVEEFGNKICVFLSNEGVRRHDFDSFVRFLVENNYGIFLYRNEDDKENRYAFFPFEARTRSDVM